MACGWRSAWPSLQTVRTHRGSIHHEIWQSCVCPSRLGPTTRTEAAEGRGLAVWKAGLSDIGSTVEHNAMVHRNQNPRSPLSFSPSFGVMQVNQAHDLEEGFLLRDQCTSSQTLGGSARK